MLQLLKYNSPFTVLTLLIVALLFKLQVLIHPQLLQNIPGDFLYNEAVIMLGYVFGGNAFAFTLIAVLMLFAQAIYINRIAAKHKLFYRPTYIPAYVFLFITSLNPVFSYFSECLLINWFVIWGVDVMLSFTQTANPRKFLFNAGFLLGIAALFQFPAIIFFLLLIIFMATLRPFNLGEWVVAILGYGTPFYFCAGLLYLFNQTELIRHWPVALFSFHADWHHHIYIYGLLGGLSILLLFAIVAMQAQLPKSGIYVRRSWVAIIFYLVISIIVVLFLPDYIQAAWLIALPVLSLLISHALNMEKNKRFSNFIFYFSLIFVLFCQIAINYK